MGYVCGLASRPKFTAGPGMRMWSVNGMCSLRIPQGRSPVASGPVRLWGMRGFMPLLTG
jgi:hypothetical protein